MTLTKPNRSASSSSSSSSPFVVPHLPLIYLITFLDLFAVSLIIPLYTTIYQALQLDPVTFGLISSIYGLTQLLCNPIIGRLSDRHGRKPFLLLSFFGTATGYLLLGAASSVWMLLLSRVVVGVVKQTLTIARAWITDHCPHGDERVRALGRLRTAVSLGFIVGPAAGGLLSARVGQMAPALAAAAFYLVDFLLVFFFVDERHPPAAITSDANTGAGGKETPLAEPDKDAAAAGGLLHWVHLVQDVLWKPNVIGLLLARLILHMGMAVSRSNLGLFMNERFGLGAEGASYMASVVGMTGVVTGLVHAPLTRLFPQRGQLVAAGLLLSLCNVVTAVTTSLPTYVMMQPVSSMSHMILSTFALASYSHAFAQSEVGFAMGVAGSFNSIGDVLSPLAAGFLFNFVGLAGPRLASALLVIVSLSLLVANQRAPPLPVVEERHKD